MQVGQRVVGEYDAAELARLKTVLRLLEAAGIYLGDGVMSVEALIDRLPAALGTKIATERGMERNRRRANGEDAEPKPAHPNTVALSRRMFVRMKPQPQAKEIAREQLRNSGYRVVA